MMRQDAALVDLEPGKRPQQALQRHVEVVAGIGMQRLHERGLDPDCATGLEYAPDFRGHRERVGKMFEDTETDDRVDAVIAQRQARLRADDIDTAKVHGVEIHAIGANVLLAADSATQVQEQRRSMRGVDHVERAAGIRVRRAVLEQAQRRKAADVMEVRSAEHEGRPRHRTARAASTWAPHVGDRYVFEDVGELVGTRAGCSSGHLRVQAKRLSRHYLFDLLVSHDDLHVKAIARAGPVGQPKIAGKATLCRLGELRKRTDQVQTRQAFELHRIDSVHAQPQAIDWQAGVGQAPAGKTRDAIDLASRRSIQSKPHVAPPAAAAGLVAAPDAVSAASRNAVA